jgi:hypothetical protein
MPNNLESAITSIVARTSSDMAREIVRAVRQSIAAEISGMPGAAPVKRGPGRPRKVVQAAGPSPAAAARPGRRKAGKRRLISDAEQNAVLTVVAKKPGLTSLGIQRAAGINSAQAARVLLKLRKTGRVKWRGQRSAATYSVA